MLFHDLRALLLSCSALQNNFRIACRFICSLRSRYFLGPLLFTAPTFALATAPAALASLAVGVFFCLFGCGYGGLQHTFQNRFFNGYARWTWWSLGTRFL